MSFTTGEEIVASLHKNIPEGSCDGVVVRSEPDHLQIALRGRGLVLRHGSLLHLRSRSKSKASAWACVHRVSLAGEVKIVELSSVRAEAGCISRAARWPVALTITAKFPGQVDGDETLVGQTVNISVSGLKAHFTAEAPSSGMVHVALQVGENKFVEALARIVRREFESPQSDCYIGLEFQRFIRGYESLLELLPNDEAA